ncbi:MAG: putative toxin-antitoxin system toxin component, PIN family [Chloroflexi bacterium]|nr:putative toxin-antitoxin system toxin component, PIN family [Chloroflexota bacterium]
MPITSLQIIDEIDRVLHLSRIRAKYNRTEPDIQAFLVTLSHVPASVPGRLVLEGVAPDPGDDKIISCAIESHADFIVTGDKHLLQLGQFRQIKVINAETFVNLLRQPGLPLQPAG